MRSHLTVVVLLLTLGLIRESASGDASTSSIANTNEQVSPIPEWFDVETLWLQATSITNEVLEIWTEAVNKLGGAENRTCAYTKITAPCEECNDEPTRRSIYALRHSLLQPGMKALMEWFDTPATHTVSSRVEEKFDSTQEPPWTLLTLDNEQPTEPQRYSHFQEKIALYSSMEQKRARRNERIPIGDFHPAAMESWFERLVPTHYLTTEDNQLVLGLKPSRKSKSPLNKHVQLTVAIDTLTREIKIFNQRAVRSFVPHFGLRIRDLNFHGTFVREPNLDVVVLNHFEYSFRVLLTTIFPSQNRFSHQYRDFNCDIGNKSPDLGVEGT